MKNIYLSKNACSPLAEYLEQKGWNICFISGASGLDTHISSHPDIYMCKLGASDESTVFFGDPDKLAAKYPGDIPYNAACTGKYFIHNLKYTDKTLLEQAEKLGLAFIDIKQGYAKCSIAVLDHTSIITSDEGIAKTLKPLGIDVLLIQKGYIKLPGYSYGFIGGTCGRVGSELIFNGDLTAHPDCKRILDFAHSKGLTVKYFENRELEDIGSILSDIQPYLNPYLDRLK